MKNNFFSKRVLTIAGSDSGGGAGIQADLKTFCAFGVYGASVITAVTAQNTRDVRSVHPVPPDEVGNQAEAVLCDIGADSVKVGMLLSGPVASAVARAIRDHRPPHLVVDPVMISESGFELLDGAGRKVLVDELFPLCDVLTPNIPEAETILGRPIENTKQAEAAARDLHGMGPKNVMLKGGHLDGNPQDLLFDGSHIVSLCRPRIKSAHTHGTGCTFSAAVAACLALEKTVEQAFRSAGDYVSLAIGSAPGIGQGRGPLNHGVKPARIPDVKETRS